MANEIPVPFVDQDIDTDTSGFMTVLVLIVGAMIFALVMSLGRGLANRAESVIASVSPVDVGADDQTSNPFDGVL